MCRALANIAFEPGSSIRRIEMCAFSFDRELAEFVVPASLEGFGEEAFGDVSALARVEFECNSRCASFAKGLFYNSAKLASICVPASVHSIEARCFRDCSGLVTVAFEAGSRLQAIEAAAFQRCHALTSLVVPASVLRIGQDCFDGCRSMTALNFEAPSRLTSLLSIPAGCIEPIAVPDSVTVAKTNLSLTPGCHFLVVFGHDSRLEVIKFYGDARGQRNCAFLQLPKKLLKAVRVKHEWDALSPIGAYQHHLESWN
jgi:hypothetical protein